MATLSVNLYPAAYSTSGSITGTKYQNAIGKGADTAAVSGNDYAASSGSYATIYYTFDTSSIPEGAQITSVSCAVKGHCENTSNSSARARLSLLAGSTQKGSTQNFTSTSAQTVTLSGATWTRAELDTLKLRFEIGYYGGLINGATLTVEYQNDPATITFDANGGSGSMAETGEYYVGDAYTLPACTFTPPASAGVDQYRFSRWLVGGIEYAVGETVELSANTVIIAQWAKPTIYIRNSSGWTAMSEGYEKTSGAWSAKAMASLFSSGQALRKE
jgi:hypothetical protein